MTYFAPQFINEERVGQRERFLYYFRLKRIEPVKMDESDELYTTVGLREKNNHYRFSQVC